MNVRPWMSGAVLAVLVALTVAGLVWTRDRGAPVTAGSSKEQAAPTGAEQERTVDMRPLLSARGLASLATTAEEQEFARQAERLADHVVDLAFADAMRQAAAKPVELSPRIRELSARKDRAQSAVEADQRRIQGITQQLTTVRGGDKERLEDQLEVAKAQLELDQDELLEATENLEEAGGDPQAKIRRLKAIYEAAQKEPRPTPAPVVEPSGSRANSLLSRFNNWRTLREKRAQLSRVVEEGQWRVAQLNQWRETLDKRVKQEVKAREEAKRSVVGVTQTAEEEGEYSKTAAKAAIASLRKFTVSQRRLADVVKAIQYEQELGEVYGSWSAVVEQQNRAALNRVFMGVLFILLLSMGVFALARSIDHLFDGMSREELRMGTLRTVAKFAVQVAGALGTLFILFGLPNQATTILGLAGAGLTVAMKDFIVAFFGWFVLMGRNGIRLGDWVEIKGVGGEVAEIGLLHTVLLETGSWSDAGHPTGRRVSFANSFAIEGHYFNFSTSGQWMWDELRLLIPLGPDPYPTIDGVQQLVERETENNAKLAEQEWRKTTGRYRVKTFSAVPGINVVPGSSGIELHVRYITRAYERHQTRRKLYHSVVELMHGKRVVEQEPAAVLTGGAEPAEV